MKQYKAIYLTDNKQVKIDVNLNASGLHFEINAQSTHIPIRQLSLELGGFDESQLFVSGNDFRFIIEDKSFLDSLYPLASIQMKEQIDTLKKKKSLIAKRFYIVLTGIILAFLIFMVGTLISLPFIRASIVDAVPIEWEVQLGNSIFDNSEKENEIHIPIVDHAIKDMSQRLIDAVGKSPYNFQFSVVENEVVNAYALPGGHMVIYTGLILKADSPEEVAGVMAHEIQHILNRHSLNRLVSSLEYYTIFSIFFGDAGGLLAILEEAGLSLVTSSFDREQESESDFRGLKLLEKAKINPEGMITFFDKLSQQEGRIAQLTQYVSTHPSSHDRVLKLKSAQSNTSFPALEIDWEAVQNALK